MNYTWFKSVQCKYRQIKAKASKNSWNIIIVNFFFIIHWNLLLAKEITVKRLLSNSIPKTTHVILMVLANPSQTFVLHNNITLTFSFLCYSWLVMHIFILLQIFNLPLPSCSAGSVLCSQATKLSWENINESKSVVQISNNKPEGRTKCH